MSIVLIIVSYLIVAFTMFVVGPLLFWFSTVKIGKFKDNSFVKHISFWCLWVLMNALISLIQNAILDGGLGFSSLLNGGFLFTLFIHILLCMFVFKVEFVPALKVSLTYTVLFITALIGVAFFAVYFSFHELILGALK